MDSEILVTEKKETYVQVIKRFSNEKTGNSETRSLTFNIQNAKKLREDLNNMDLG